MEFIRANAGQHSGGMTYHVLMPNFTGMISIPNLFILGFYFLREKGTEYFIFTDSVDKHSVSICYMQSFGEGAQGLQICSISA